MPELDLGDWPNGLDDVACVHVFATMLHPNHPDKREAIIAGAPLPRQIQELLLKEYAHKTASVRRGHASGELLFVIRLIGERTDEREASINKAATLVSAFRPLERSWEGQLVPYNPSTLKRWWRDYKNVSHLWAALGLSQQKSQTMEGDPQFSLQSPKSLPAFLAVAEDMRRFGETNFTRARQPGKNTKQPTLDPAKTWKVPVGLSLPPISINLPDPPKDVLQALQNYDYRTGA